MTYEVRLDPAALRHITHIFCGAPPRKKVFDFGGSAGFVLPPYAAAAVVAFHALTKV